MARYNIEIVKSAGKELKKIKGKDQENIIQRIRGLAKDPSPPGSKKLSGEDKYRIRQGNYRILYQIFVDTVLVVVVKIGHRRDVYKK